MARKNRYEYSLLKETYNFLNSTSFRSVEDRYTAQRLLDMIADFLDKEHVTLTRLSPQRTFSERMGIPDPNSYSVGNRAYSPMDYLNQVTDVPSGLTQAPRVDETEGENPF